MKNYLESIESSSAEVHAAMKAKGFWDVPQPLNLSVALAIGELYEGLEAARTGKEVAHKANFESDLQNNKAVSLQQDLVQIAPYFWVPIASFQDSFKSFIKDTLADELADTVIRCLDFATGQGLRLNLVQYSYNRMLELQAEDLTYTTLSLPAMILSATDYLSNIKGGLMKEESLALALHLIYRYCLANEIDLNWHIHYKLLYNATRAKMHGKKY